MFDLSVFTTAEAWISLVTLMFLEIVLGVDNIVFISITSSRLPREKQHIGRRLGLLGAMVMRIAFLSVASYFVHMTTVLFSIDFGFYSHGVSVRDIVLFAGGAYLIYKGVVELKDMMALKDEKAETSSNPNARKITLPRAVGIIMVMDIVFSMDSVITAVGLAEHLIIIIIAVIAAVLIMMAFIDPIADFIDRNAEMKILALTFIAMIGLLLVLNSLGINTGIYVLDMNLEKLMVYFAMAFSVIMELVQIRYKNNLRKYQVEIEGNED